jgi:Bacterial protein of unknown function (DUF899)
VHVVTGRLGAKAAVTGPATKGARVTVEMTRLAKDSDDYVAAGEESRNAEIALMEQVERVAALRRQLPAGPAVEDYVFEEGPNALSAGDEPIRRLRLSELFGADGCPLIVYHLIYGKADTAPCPMCTMWIDGYNGIVDHVARNADGNQDSTVSVFTRDPDGSVRHFYTGHPWMSGEMRERGIDLHLTRLEPARPDPAGTRRLVPVTELPELRHRPTASGSSFPPDSPSVRGHTRAGGAGTGAGARCQLPPSAKRQLAVRKNCQGSSCSMRSRLTHTSSSGIGSGCGSAGTTHKRSSRPDE